MVRADLHIHTRHSDDGDCSPKAIIDAAVSTGIDVLAFCDHDSVQAYDNLAGCTCDSAAVVPAVELSGAWGEVEIHLLAYEIDPTDAQLQKLLALIDQQRRQQTSARLGQLKSAGFSVCAQLLSQLAGGQPAKTLVLLQMLLEKNPDDPRLRAYGPPHAPDWMAFYRDYLAPGQPAHARFEGFSPCELVDRVRQLGAAPVLAHPAALCRFTHSSQVTGLIRKLSRAGLFGLEAYTSWHQPHEAQEYNRLADRLGLAVTVGSDFHGKSCKPEVELGDPQWTPPCIHRKAVQLFRPIDFTSVRGCSY